MSGVSIKLSCCEYLFSINYHSQNEKKACPFKYLITASLSLTISQLEFTLSFLTKWYIKLVFLDYTVHSHFASYSDASKQVLHSK